MVLEKGFQVCSRHVALEIVVGGKGCEIFTCMLNRFGEVCRRCAVASCDKPQLGPERPNPEIRDLPLNSVS